MTRRRLTALASALFALIAALPSPSHALPQGRGWANVDSLGFAFTATRIEADPTGTPMLAAIHMLDSLGVRREWNALTWRCDRFERVARIEGLGALSAPEPIVRGQMVHERFIESRKIHDLLWLSSTRDASGAGRLLWGGWTEGLSGEMADRLALRADTVMTAWLQSSESAAARGKSLAWVARCEQRFPQNETYGVRVRWRRMAGHGSRDEYRWQELPERGVNEFTCTIAPLPSDEAMLVYAGESGLAWVRTRGLAWADSGRLDVRPWFAAHPRLRLETNGDLTLLWTTKEWVHIARCRAGRWAIGDSLRATHPAGQTFWAGWCDISREADHAPALAWGDRGFGANSRDVLCVAFPDSGGGAITGEEVPGSDSAFIPTVARDRNGDVWLAWSHLDRPGVFVTHTYVNVTAETPRVTRRGPTDRVEWTLSAEAPGSWWVIERAEAGDFTAVGRVQAGAMRELTWSGRAGSAAARYRVRRDSVDERTSWISTEAAAR